MENKTEKIQGYYIYRTARKAGQIGRVKFQSPIASVVLITDGQGNWGRGISLLEEGEQFCRAIGRYKALSRARTALYSKQSSHFVSNLPVLERFKHVIGSTNFYGPFSRFLSKAKEINTLMTMICLSEFNPTLTKFEVKICTIENMFGETQTEAETEKSN